MEDVVSFRTFGGKKRKRVQQQRQQQQEQHQLCPKEVTVELYKSQQNTNENSFSASDAPKSEDSKDQVRFKDRFDILATIALSVSIFIALAQKRFG